MLQNYQRHLTSKAAPNDEGVDDREHMDGMRDNQDTLDVNTPQVAPAPNRRGRKRKQAVVEEEQVAPVVDQVPAQVLFYLFIIMNIIFFFFLSFLI